MEKIVCVATKPLQYMMCDNITRSRNAHRTLIIVNNFNNAKAVSESINRLGEWDKVIFAKKRTKAFLWAMTLRPDQLYIDTDVGSRMFRRLMMVKCMKPSCKVFVYEEGQNTYKHSSTLFDASGGWATVLRRYIYPRLGCGIFYGGSYWCSGVYVCKPEVYRQAIGANTKKIYKITPSPAEYCTRNRDQLFSIFCSENEILSARGEECVIYLSAYHISEDFLESDLFAARTAYRVLKPHPHIRGVQEKYARYVDVVIPSSVPAELLLLEAMGKFDHVYAYHHGSSIERYIGGDNIDYIRI